ncbi:MAG: hypothetical protein MUE59_17205 [Thiobacillaceae bacterium]|jgi:hypothetical protein|nr:hypothetical protein [Thiobacillaceae bacterium]
MIKTLVLVAAGSLLLGACGSTPPSPGGGSSAPVNLNDLVGIRGASFDGEMQRRGFINKGGFQRDGRAMGLWYNSASRQCVESTTVEGRVQAIDEVSPRTCR